MGKPISDSMKISPFLVLFLITSVQVGVGILSFQSKVVEHASYDAWISVIIAGIGVHIIIWIAFKMLRQDQDIFDIQKELFGKYLGGLFGFIQCLYFLVLSTIALRLYIEIIQVWMFPHISILYLGIFFLILVYYVINGGFRVVVGICFLGTVIPIYLLFTLIFPLEFAHFHNLLPVLNHSVKDLMLSSKEMTLSFLGFSTLFIFFPFIKHPKKAHKWAHFGVLFTIVVYVAISMVAFVFYDEEQIKTVIWPTLGMWKIIEMPFVERFEYIGISSWALVILPNMTLTLWASTRGMKRLFRFNQRKTVIVFLIIVLIANVLINGHERISLLSEYISRVGFYMVYFYIPFLFIVYTIYNKVRKSK
ncbi:spore germination protein (amino acid permease) [Salinibacillus kushneri]|uniref:Spore germination protein (Amino acid permease) n=1 Tax=Salinibacillus kushneri TaxID=237682 RepID=A0A1I0IPW5_9BACI|nr:GerAB/ArcD/ProY family transporter [Salinibacillus kushneri]SET99133.1 spore germination protein (amino acid permease) [Salinibacillus kushneri]